MNYRIILDSIVLYFYCNYARTLRSPYQDVGNFKVPFGYRV